MEEQYIEDRCYESAFKIYNPAVHPREPYTKGRNIRTSPFYEREVELGGHFMELGGWERAHGYAANEHLLEKFGDRVPVRENEWDNRHFWRVSNAEHMELSENCGIINLSHFSIVDVEGPDHVALMEWLCAAKVGGDNMVGKGIYTHFLDDEGMVRADFTVIRMADRCRLINGADAGPARLSTTCSRIARGQGLRCHHHRCDGEISSPSASGARMPATTLKKVVADPDGPSTSRTSPSPPSSRSSIAGKDGFRLPPLLCRRAGLGASHEIRGRPGRLGRAAR